MTIHDFLRALRRRKIRGRLDRDGDIHFTHASLDLCLRRSEDAPDFFSLEYGGTFREIEVGDEEFYAYLLLAAAVTRGVKIGKVCVGRKDGGLALHFLVQGYTSPKDFSRNLPRYLNIMLKMADDFFSVLGKDEAREDGEDGEDE